MITIVNGNYIVVNEILIYGFFIIWRRIHVYNGGIRKETKAGT